MTPDENLAVVKRHVAMLMEHFDSVQVFATKSNDEDETTFSVNYGSGNWYARYGQVQEWMVQQASRADAQIRKEDDDD